MPNFRTFSMVPVSFALQLKSFPTNIFTFHPIFSFLVENITYLCTKVNIENETAVNQGCFKQIKNGHEIEVCVCESYAGRNPCNHGNVIYGFMIAIPLTIIFMQFIVM